jgi:hypothetical protein
MSKSYPSPLVDQDRNPVPIDEAALVRIEEGPDVRYNEVELIKEVRRLRAMLRKAGEALSEADDSIPMCDARIRNMSAEEAHDGLIDLLLQVRDIQAEVQSVDDEMSSQEAQAHCIESDGSGSVTLYGEDKDGGFVITVPGHRLGALVLAVLDAKDGKETRR